MPKLRKPSTFDWFLMLEFVTSTRFTSKQKVKLDLPKDSGQSKSYLKIALEKRRFLVASEQPKGIFRLARCEQLNDQMMRIDGPDNHLGMWQGIAEHVRLTTFGYKVGNDLIR